MPGRQCCVPWCRGDEVMVTVGKHAIPELKKWPCQYIKEDVEEKIKSYSPAKPDYICLRHLREYKAGSLENGRFELHDVHTCPVVTDIIAGALLPQEGYLLRVYGNMPPNFENGYMQYITDKCKLFQASLSDARAKSFTTYSLSPVAAIGQRGTKRTVSGDKKTDKEVQQVSADELQEAQFKIVQLQELLKVANKSSSARVAAKGHENLETVAQLQSEILLLKRNLKDSVDEKNANKAFIWANESILKNFSDKDFQALTGIEKDAWVAYVDLFELHDFVSYWGKREMPWKDALLLTQVKLRQNTIYVVLANLFFVEKQRCSEYFRVCIEFSCSLYVLLIQFDVRELVAENRINGLRADRCGLPMTKVSHVTDAMSTRLQKFNNPETKSRSHSEYKGDERIKFQGSIDASSELAWMSKGYLGGAGASDQEILENGESVGSYQFKPTKMFDLMKADDIIQGDRGTLIRSALLRHNKKTNKHLSMMLPPFLKKNKLSFEEKEKGGEIARVRYSSSLNFSVP